MIEKEDIETLIIENKQSNLSTHFNDAFFYNTLKYSGEIRENEILLWSSSFWLRGGYPIFHLHFNSENQLYKISTALNPFGKLINQFLLIALVLLTLLPIFSEGLADGWRLSMLVLFIAVVVFLIMRKAGTHEKQIMTQTLRDAIEKIEREKFPDTFTSLPKSQVDKKGEWTIKNIITRLIMYPLCALIIYFSFLYLLPSDKPIHGIIAIGICVLYYIADLSNIFKK